MCVRRLDSALLPRQHDERIIVFAQKYDARAQVHCARARAHENYAKNKADTTKLKSKRRKRGQRLQPTKRLLCMFACEGVEHLHTRTHAHEDEATQRGAKAAARVARESWPRHRPLFVVGVMLSSAPARSLACIAYSTACRVATVRASLGSMTVRAHERERSFRVLASPLGPHPMLPCRSMQLCVRAFVRFNKSLDLLHANKRRMRR